MSYFENLRLQKLGLAPKTTGAKPKKPMKKFSDKKLAEMKEQKDENGDTELVRFFKSAMKRMTAHCANCFLRTETQVYSAAIFSICHILIKEKLCVLRYEPILVIGLNFVLRAIKNLIHHHLKKTKPFGIKDRKWEYGK